RKTELNAEIERLEQQLGDFSSHIQTLLHEPAARARPARAAPERSATGVPPAAAARAYQPVVVEAESAPPRQRAEQAAPTAPPPAPAAVPEPARAAPPPAAPMAVPATPAPAETAGPR